MYTTAKNVQIIIALLKKHQIKTLVLSPGGTNSPFVRGVQDDEFFNCYSVVDERSAAYFAIGLSLRKKEPVVICCTSAQATRNYMPGLTEAFYKHVPILAITFSKHPQYTYQGYMQAPDQTSIPKDAVKKTFALPYVTNQHDFLQCSRMVNEALLELNHYAPGPVQLNVPMLDDELGIDDTELLPDVKEIRLYREKDLEGLQIKGKKVLIVVGENSQLKYSDFDYFLQSHNAAIYVNHLSNIKGERTVWGNLLLSCISQKFFDTNLCPDILITCGGQTGDYPLYHKLAESNCNYEHWSVNSDGSILDTYDHLTKVFECDPSHFFSYLCDGDVCDEYFKTWQSYNLRLKRDVSLPLSNIYIAQQMTPKIPEGSIVNFAILNSLRSWSLFEFKNQVDCNSNVAAFGIDGGMSTFIGQSVTTERLCFYITGDLAFYYDMNSLAIKYLNNNVRIILINNNGGIEFKLWGSEESKRNTDRYIAAANHFKSAEGWAKTCGFDYISIETKEEFDSQVSKLCRSSNNPILMEVNLPDIDEALAYAKILSCNSGIINPSKKTILRNAIVDVIGEDTFLYVKGVIGRN